MASAYCISILHITIAYLQSISWVDFWSFGGVFVRFLVVLEWSEGCFGRSFGGLGGSWAAPGRSWADHGPLLAALGSLLADLGPLLGRLGPLLARLGPLLGRLGPLLWRSRAALGAILAALGRLLGLLAGPWGTKIDFPEVLIAKIEFSKNIEKPKEKQ